MPKCQINIRRVQSSQRLCWLIGRCFHDIRNMTKEEGERERYYKGYSAHWRVIQPLFLIRDEDEYDKAIATLNALIDEVGTDEQHPLYELLDTLGTVIHAYEAEHHLILECSGKELKL